MKMHSLLTIAVSAAAVALAGQALAAKPADAIEYRQGIMMGIGWNIGALGAMVKGDLPYDQAKFAFLAGRAAVLAPMALEAFTPDTADTNPKRNRNSGSTSTISRNA